MPCDAILLDGFCNVNESDLTGESNLVMKTAIPRDNKKFSYSRKKFILYQGTVINKCESSYRDGRIKALAINTGYNTLRSNLIQNLLLPKQSNFSLFGDLKYYLLAMTFIYLITIFFNIYFYRKYAQNKTYQDCRGLGSNSLINWQLRDIIRKCIDCLTVILPPTLPISLTFTSFYFHFNLNRKLISCISDVRMTAAGRVNIFVLDKTGTLTEEGLELYGFQISKISIEANNELCFDSIERDTIVYNQVHKQFWKNFCKDPNNEIFHEYNTNPRNNVIYFLECLATCHTIDKIKGETLGNSIDKRIFDCLGWKLENYHDKQNNQLQYEIIPNDSYKITEGLAFSQIKNNNLNREESRYKLVIVKRFEFSSKFQSNSVIVRNSLDKSFRFFIKGAPEKIIEICNPSTIPDSFSDKLFEHTQSGYRVLACATKPIPSNNYKSFEDRSFFESDLNFLGLIVFKNKLKRDTKQIISKLKQSNIKLIMATGDNPFTSISVAQECGLIDNDKEILFCNVDKEIEKDEEKLKWYNVNIRKDSFVHKFPFHEKLSGARTLYNRDNDNYYDKKNLDDEKEVSNIELTSRKLIPRKSLSIPVPSSYTTVEKKKQMLFIVKHELVTILENFKDKTNFYICFTGKAFEYFLKYYREESILLKEKQSLYKKKVREDTFEEDIHDNIFHKLGELLIERCKVFSRMQPNNKVDLVNFLKENKENIVGMCGDGANDCGALLCADTGISISQKNKNKITAHFYSEDDSIECIETILRNGRACYENSVIIFKFMILYGITQNCSVLLFFSIASSDFSMHQYVYIDCFTVLISCLLASKTGANYKLKKDSFTNQMMGKQFVLSIIGQSIIQVGFQLAFFLLFILKRIDYCYLPYSGGKEVNNDYDVTVQGSVYYSLI